MLALPQGAALPGQSSAIASQLARFTGLTEVIDTDLRIEIFRFVRLLRSQRRTVGRLDSRTPASSHAFMSSSSSTPATPRSRARMPCFNDYVRGDCSSDDLPYEILAVPVEPRSSRTNTSAWPRPCARPSA